jgi:hypothetical protein
MNRMSPAEVTSNADVRAFSGNPARYCRLSILFSLGIHAYLYGGMVVIEYLIRGETWIFSWKPMALAAGSAIFFAWYMYRMIISFDAQRGRGSRWNLVTTTVKLPERR